MELKESKRTLHMPQCVCDDFEERAVDMDILLPDYCPEVSAILKCVMRPIVTARFQSGDRYTVDGVTLLRILYLAEDRTGVHSFEAKQPFSVRFRCDGAIHHTVDVKSDYVNCRANAPRRLDVHGAFRVFLKAIGQGDVEVFADPGMRDVFCQNRSVTSIEPLCEAEKAFVIDETIDLGVRAERLIYSDMTVISCDTKTLMNKLIVKGTLSLKAFYCGANNDMATTVQEIPFSQIVDIEGLCDEWHCDSQVDVGECEVRLQQSENGGSLLSVSGKLTVHIRCSRPQTEEVVLDAYSVLKPLLCETSPLHISSTKERAGGRVSLHQTVSLPEGVSQLVDYWAELKSVETDKSADGSRLLVCLLICMITRDENGTLSYMERTADCCAVCDGASDDVSLRLVDVNGTLVGSSLRLTAQAEWQSCGEQSETLSVVSTVVEDEQHMYPASNAAIRIVYANPGETLWDIAKCHRSCVEDIMAENDLSYKEILHPTMLMIPLGQ